jgi:hypothetical protein
MNQIIQNSIKLKLEANLIVVKMIEAHSQASFIVKNYYYILFTGKS